MHPTSNDQPPAPIKKATEAKPSPATHDTAPPEALLSFMLQGWKPAMPRPIKVIEGHEIFRARRKALSSRFVGETLIVPSGHEKVRANDTHHRFRPSSDFVYLTGNQEADCVLVLIPGSESSHGHRDVLFVEPNPGKTTSTFFTDRHKGELWVGPRFGVPQSQERYHVDECKGLPELENRLKSLLASGKPFRLLRGISPSIDRLFPDQAERDQEFGAIISERRLIKDESEIREIVHAIKATKRGLEKVIRALPTARTERELEVTFNGAARIEGNGVGYGTIAASGSNACILHWTRNDAALKRGKLLLLDAGIEGHSLYTADITRTLPINGKYNKAQRELYDLVIEAHEMALREVRPENDFLAPNRAATEVLAKGLERLKILKSAKEALQEDRQYYRRYTLHNVSHMLGLDVHDGARARPEVYRQGRLKPGMVLTIEPGLYFQPDDLTVAAKYRGIGIRVEDDVLVTETGCRVLSADIPRKAEDVEAWMAKLWADENKAKNHESKRKSR